MAATPETCPSRIYSTVRRGSRTSSTANHWHRNTAVRPDCWFRICTCGRVPRGYAMSSYYCRTSRDSGKAPAITIMGIHGASSGTGATDLAGGDRRGDPGGDPGDAYARPRCAGLARTPGRSARRCPAHRRRRLHGTAVLLHRVQIPDAVGVAEFWGGGVGHVAVGTDRPGG